MVSRTSKKLPVVGCDHTFMIAYVSDPKYALEQAEKHYQLVKRKQCIGDYNMAVKDLDQVYEKLMEIDDVYEKVEAKLNELKAEKDGLKTLLEDCNSRLVLAKAKLQQLNVATSALLKSERTIKKVQQTQTTSTASSSTEDVETVKNTPKPFITIPEDDEDKAIKLAIDALPKDDEDGSLIDLTLDMDLQQQTVQNIVEIPSNTALQQNVVQIPSSTGPKYIFTSLPGTSSNIAIMPQNITLASSNTVKTPQSILKSRNIIKTPQNVTGTSLNIVKAAMDLAQVEPPTQTFIKIGNELFQPVSQVQSSQQQQQKVSSDLQAIQQEMDAQQDPLDSPSKSFAIPEGFRKTRFENTLEKINPVPEKDQKAGKRFFCSICMLKNIETGYTKRFDLTKHLTRCGKEGTEKPFKCTGYGECVKAFARVENLRQHVALEHTKETLYKCKKCGRGFSRSTEATNHRRECFQKNDEDNEPDDEEKDKPEEN